LERAPSTGGVLSFILRVMSKSDWAIVALNVSTLLMAVVGLASYHRDPMSMALALTVITTLVNGGWVLRRARPQEAKPVVPRQLAETDPPLELADEMDVHRVLDIDQRLEALERAETRRIREMAAAGLISAPEAPLETLNNVPSARQHA